MIIGRCRHCNYVARYNSNYFTIPELQRHIISFPLEDWECDHSLIYEEENNPIQLSSKTNSVEAVCS